MQDPSKADDDVLIVLVGLGAVATTLVAGTSVYRARGAVPEGVWSFNGTVVDCGHRVAVREMLEIPQLSKIRFAAFDVGAVSALALAQKAGVLSNADLEAARTDLSDLRSMPGVTEETDGNNGNGRSIE